MTRRDIAYHAVTGVLTIRFKDTVCGGVVSGGVHGIGAGLVERGLQVESIECSSTILGVTHTGNLTSLVVA